MLITQGLKFCKVSPTRGLLLQFSKTLLISIVFYIIVPISLNIPSIDLVYMAKFNQIPSFDQQTILLVFSSLLNWKHDMLIGF